jgi:3-isopropylmalate dehydrogenase
MSRTRYSVACLAGHGVGPELIAEASRAVDAASQLHGFVVDEHHVAVGAEALIRFGHPYPSSSRHAVLAADAVLVAPGGDETLDAIEPDLDLRASVARVRFDGCELAVLAPLADDGWRWTVERAFGLARTGRARVSLAGVDADWRAEVAHVGLEHDGMEVEQLSAADALQELVLTPQRFDVVVCPPELARTAAELAGCRAARRVAAWGRLAASGPGVFGAVHDSGHDGAGDGVADPTAMLLAAALMLGEGLGERSAARTLSLAIGRARSAQASTRRAADDVLAELPYALNVEFLREAV